MVYVTRSVVIVELVKTGIMAINVNRSVLLIAKMDDVTRAMAIVLKVVLIVTTMDCIAIMTVL